MRLMQLRVLAAMLVGLALPFDAGAQTILKLANEYPATTVTGEADQRFAARVAELSKGQLKIELYPEAKLGFRTIDQLDAVADGKVPIASSFVSAFGGKEPMFLLPALPFLTRTVDDARRLFEIARPTYEAAFARHHQRLLYAVVWPPAGIWAKEPVGDAPAIARLKVRAFDSLSAEVLSSAGAKATAIPISEMRPKLAAGEINAVLSSGDGGVGQRLWQDLPVFNEINYAFPLSLTSINEETFSKLSPAEQEALLTAAREVHDGQWSALTGRVERNYKVMRDNGVRIVEAPAEVKAALTDAARAAIAKWADRAGQDARKILDTFR